MNGNTFRTLEFDAIRALLVRQAGSPAGKARLQELAPALEPGHVRARLALTTQAVRLLQQAGGQAYHDLPDLAEVLPSARVEGLHLEPLALLDVASFLEGAGEIARQVAAADGAPELAQKAARVADFSDLVAALRRALLPGGVVADDASPRLAETRRGLARLKAQLQSVMESFLRGKDAERLLQDKLVTTRNDRYVLLLKAEHRGSLPGIIHGSSGSGATLFVEPMPAVDLNNDIVSLGEEERREVIRVLRDLTARVARRGDAIADAMAVMGELDALQAMAQVAREMKAVEPAIAERSLDLELRDARHPLLMSAISERLGIPRRARREPVPVTVRVGFGTPVLVISGPNTGGKTVALKTVGLLALMAQSGLHVPAAEGSVLPVFRRVYADIGDDQSIAADLSTFSAHLRAIVEMTRDLEAPTLVLLDEIGGGTDPTEGGALGVAVVDHFRQRGAMVVATTHHGLLKSYAQSTAGVAAASFGYDPASYEPTYRLALGVPGRSLALEMAERLGLPAPVVHDARARLENKEAQAEALLKKLEDGRLALERDTARLAEEREALAAARARAEADERAFAAQKRQALESFRRDLAQRGERAARQAADAIREAVQRLEAERASTRKAANVAAKARTEAIGAIRAAQEEATADLDLPREADAPALPLAVGARVRLRSLGVTGEVLQLAGDHAEVAVRGKRLKVPPAELIALPAAAAPGAVVASAAPVSAPSASEINVVGLRVDEALPRVDKALDTAALADRQQLRVVHGHGEGKLRRAVAEMLDGHPHVASFRPGGAGEGGAGVTVVELRE
ncbi:MAG TPA: endonuclease MutS2 [Vicinamibacteria bacterium]